MPRTNFADAPWQSASPNDVCRYSRHADCENKSAKLLKINYFQVNMAKLVRGSHKFS